MLKCTLKGGVFLMLTKEQRAHDLALTVIANIINKEVNGFPDKTKLFEIIKAYEHVYKDSLRAFEENI